MALSSSALKTRLCDLVLRQSPRHSRLPRWHLGHKFWPSTSTMASHPPCLFWRWCQTSASFFNDSLSSSRVAKRWRLFCRVCNNFAAPTAPWNFAHSCEAPLAQLFHDLHLRKINDQKARFLFGLHLKACESMRQDCNNRQRNPWSSPAFVFECYFNGAWTN